MTDTDTESVAEVKELCNLYFEEFTSTFKSLTIADACPICGIVGARHVRLPPTEPVLVPTPPRVSDAQPGYSKHLLSSTAMAFMKLEKQLPEWNRSTECRTFLKRVELVLKTNDGIPSDDWPRVFLYVVKEQSAIEWIMTNIIDTKLSWPEAKQKFSSHFQRAEYGTLLLRKYQNLKQLQNESVQSYADRFVEVCEEIERADYETDALVLDHFLQHLHTDIRQRFNDYLADERVRKDDVEYQIESLSKLIRICIIFDVAARTSGITGTGTSVAKSSTN